MTGQLTRRIRTMPSVLEDEVVKKDDPHFMKKIVDRTLVRKLQEKHNFIKSEVNRHVTELYD